MACFLGAGAVGKAGAGAAFGPIGLAVCGVAALGYVAYRALEQNGGGGRARPTIIQMQQDGDMDSSEVENFFHLGATGTYQNIIDDERPFNQGEDGYKYHVEADHIPPLQSLRRARVQPEFPALRWQNERLYNLVRSLETDERGLNRLTVQVPTHHHRDALSSGASRASTAVRELLARRIARGEVKTMLKQAFIIAHPYASQQIREEAGIGNRTPRRRMLLTRDRTMNIYRRAFLSLLDRYYENEQIINYQEYTDLIKFVNQDMYLDRDSEEYREILKIVERGRI